VLYILHVVTREKRFRYRSNIFSRGSRMRYIIAGMIFHRWQEIVARIAGSDGGNSPLPEKHHPSINDQEIFSSLIQALQEPGKSWVKMMGSPLDDQEVDGEVLLHVHVTDNCMPPIQLTLPSSIIRQGSNPRTMGLIQRMLSKWRNPLRR
jgi:hypothetical protein